MFVIRNDFFKLKENMNVMKRTSFFQVTGNLLTFPKGK